MTTYSFRALDTGGAISNGSVEADSLPQARQRLADRGLIPIRVDATRVRTGGSPPLEAGLRFRGRRARIGTGDLALGLQSLATLLEAGLPLDQALGTLEALAPPSWAPFLPGLRASVRQGDSLGSALQNHRVGLPPAAEGLVRAGEDGGGLAMGVRRAADLVDADAELRSSIRAALAYPLLLAIAGAGALILLVGVVLPRFAVILSDLGQELPATARAVLGAAELFRLAGLPTLGFVAAGVLAGRVWTATPTGRAAWHKRLLTVPWIRVIRLGQASARACAALGALLRTGSPLPAALRSAGDASGDQEVASRLGESRLRVARGDRLADALDATSALSPAAVRLIAAGERSGRLADMLEKAAELEARETERRIRRSVQLIEPVMILGFGAAVALVAAALLQAVYAVRPAP